jgi:outer membrane protein OmpA-like peptidoglycan-associated protein
MTFFQKGQRIRTSLSKGRSWILLLGTILSVSAGCATKPAVSSMAPGPTPDHGFPGVSVSEGSSQWPRTKLPEEETTHRIYTETPPPTPSPGAPVAASTEKKRRMPTQRTVYFSFNSARLSYWDEVVLNTIARELKRSHYQEILLHGSTDPLGSEAYNKKLGLRRSLAVKRYLISRGLPPKKLRALSWGDSKSRLFSACRRKSPLCHSQSRSVRIDIKEASAPSSP